MQFATYNGHVPDIIGQILGPDLYGGFSVAVEADYNAEENVTRVRFEPIGPNDQREAVYDEFGQLRLVTEE